MALTKDEGQLVEEHYEYVQRLVSTFIKKFNLPAEERDEYESAGLVGLIDAAHRYDPERGGQFHTYAFIRIRGAILDYVRNEGKARFGGAHDYKAHCAAFEARECEVQEESGSDEVVSVLNSLSRAAIAYTLAHEDNKEVTVSAQGDLEEELLARDTERTIRHLVKQLPEKERVIIEDYYFEDIPTPEIAKRHDGMSKSWVSRLHVRALDSLRELLQEEEECLV